MRLRRLYLDSNIVVAYYYHKDPNNQHKRALEFLQKMSKCKNVCLVLSDFTFTEFLAATVIKKDYVGDQVKHVEEMLRTKKIGRKYTFTLVPIEGKEKNYTVYDFLIDIQSVLLAMPKREGFQDCMQCAIIKNNKLREIVTFDKKCFEQFPNLKPLFPEEVI